MAGDGEEVYVAAIDQGTTSTSCNPRPPRARRAAGPRRAPLQPTTCSGATVEGKTRRRSGTGRVEDLWEVAEPQLSPSEKLNSCFEDIPVASFPSRHPSQGDMYLFNKVLWTGSKRA
ncbi:hypothetical protein EJB05_39915, partial [Eragrostis curvula]